MRSGRKIRVFFRAGVRPVNEPRGLDAGMAATGLELAAEADAG